MMPEAIHAPIAATPHQATCGDGFTTTGAWFGPPERPLAGWWTTPDHPSRDGVVIAAPLGYEYWSTHRSLRTLAEALARAGWNVLRFDWDGTGDSAGEAGDPDRVAAWRASLTYAVEAMREAGMERIVLVGLRLGATFAILDAAALGIDAVVACAPVAGKRFVKELKMLGIAHPEQSDVLMYSGLVIGPETAADLAKIDPEKIVPASVARTLIVARSASESNKLAAALRADQRCVDVQECPQMQSMLDVTAGDAKVPDSFIEFVVGWLGRGRAGVNALVVPARPGIDMPWRDGHVRGAFTLIDGLAATCSTPLSHNSDTVVVFLNSGAEPHVGPARAWVEYARTLTLQGYDCLRTDFSGWGESPDEGRDPGRPYDAHCVADTMRIVKALRARYKRIVLAGLCAGAWVALKAAQQVQVEGVFALNPQLYWQPGHPIIILILDSKRWWAPYHARNRRLARLGVWSLLDVIGIRHVAATWMIALRKQKIPVMFSFAEGDEGLMFLRERCGRRLARETRSGYLTVEEVSGIDHQNYRLWRRPAIIEQMQRFLASLPAAKTGDSV